MDGSPQRIGIEELKKVKDVVLHEDKLKMRMSVPCSDVCD